MSRERVRPTPGRPVREDWRTGLSLPTEPPMTRVLAEVSWSPHRQRFTVLEGADDATVRVEQTDGSERRVLPGQVRRYRVVSDRWLANDFVLLVGVPAEEWRGVVLGSDGFEVAVESTRGREWMFGDELESPTEREEREQARRVPPLKRGPMASDPAAERINAEASERRRQASEDDGSVDDRGFVK